MTHKRYQNPQKGYSRRQQKSVVAAVIDEDLEFAAQVARTDFGAGSITSLMATPEAPAAIPPAATPQSSVDAPAAPPAEPAVQAGRTEVRRGAFGAVEHETNARIRAVDRLLALLRIRR